MGWFHKRIESRMELFHRRCLSARRRKRGRTSSKFSTRVARQRRLHQNSQTASNIYTVLKSTRFIEINKVLVYVCNEVCNQCACLCTSQFQRCYLHKLHHHHTHQRLLLRPPPLSLPLLQSAASAFGSNQENGYSDHSGSDCPPPHTHKRRSKGSCAQDMASSI